MGCHMYYPSSGFCYISLWGITNVSRYCKPIRYHDITKESTPKTHESRPGGGWYAGPPGEQLKRAKRKAQAYLKNKARKRRDFLGFDHKWHPLIFDPLTKQTHLCYSQTTSKPPCQDCAYQQFTFTTLECTDFIKLCNTLSSLCFNPSEQQICHLPCVFSWWTRKLSCFQAKKTDGTTDDIFLKYHLGSGQLVGPAKSENQGLKKESWKTMSFC